MAMTDLLTNMMAIKLDVGCGYNKQKGFVGIDQYPREGVDIVHDIQDFPWPIPDNICSTILLSHVWEHVEPKYRFQLMDELWRIIKHDGQLFISSPHDGSFLAAAHPAHYMCPNHATFQFFDPDFHLYKCCDNPDQKPWKILTNDPNVTGNIELVMEPRKDAVGDIALGPPSDSVKVLDEVKCEIVNKSDKKKDEDHGREPNNNNSEREGRQSEE